MGMKKLGAAALTLLVLLAGCGDDSGGSSDAASTGSGGSAGGPTTTAAPEVCTADKAGGSVTMAVYSETRGLDPTVSSGSGATGGTEMSAIYDTVMQWDYKTGAYLPRLAQSLTPSADFVTWTLKLKPGIKFGNGDPFTVRAVVASFERHKDPASKSVHRNNAEYVKSMTVIDDLTMEFTLTNGWADFPYILTDEPGMIPNPAVITALGTGFNLAPKGAGVGPYEIDTFKVGESLTLKAKTDYWGGPVCIKELKFVALNSAQASYDSLKAGNIDMTFIDDAKVLAQVRADKTDVHADLVGGQGVMINNGVRKSATPFTDIRLRQAALAALDVKALDQRITGGTSIATAALFPEQSIYNGGVPGPAYDTAKAKQLVSTVKAEGTWNGSVRILCPSTQTDQALAFKTALEAVGFTVNHEIAATSGDLIAKVITDANYDLACWSIQLFEAAPYVKLDRFLRSTSSANRNGYSNPDMDKALDELRLAKDVAATKVAVGKIQTIMNATGSHAILRAGETSVAYSKKIKGLTYNAETMVYFDKAFKTS